MVKIMQKVLSFLKENKLNILLLILWLILTCLSLCFHEVWRDEAQAWCIVRDSNFIDICKMARIEGHPFLWYLILFIPAKMGFSVFSMQVISLLLVFAAVCLILFKSAFNKFEKLIIIFSAGFIYYLPVIARNYSLIPLFLFILAILYPKRSKFPIFYSLLIVFLSHSHLYMLGFCLVLAFLFVLENRRKILPVLILTINFLVLFFIFFNVYNINYALMPDVRMGLSFSKILTVIPKVLTYYLMQYSAFTRNYFSIISAVLFYPFLFMFLFAIYKCSKKIFIIAAVSLSYMFLIFSKVYFNGILYQKVYLMFLILIFCFWIVKEGLKKIPLYGVISFYILFSISCLISPISLIYDVKYNFSNGKQIAQYIKTNLNNEKEFIAFGNPYLYSSVAAYLPKRKFYNVITESYITFYSYSNSKNDKKEDFPENAKYSIIQEDIDVSKNEYLKLVYKSGRKILSSNTEREIFDIYIEKD